MHESDCEGLDELVERLNQAVQLRDPHAVTHKVKNELEQIIREGTLRLSGRFHRTREDTYARRLLHRDPHGGYTVVVMTWAPGQRTGLHDHAGIWCVEGVVEGRMQVTQYDLVDESGGFAFTQKQSVSAAVGSAGCLIPPFEYHVLANALAEQPSITLHVYGGEMTSCSVYEPRADGRYERRQRALSYTD